MSESQGPQIKQAAFIFIFITILLDMLALGMIIPVLPKLIEGFVDGDTVRAAQVFGVFGTVWAAMQFVFSPLLGALSDRFGRRPIILLSNFGLGVDYILMALAPSLTWLFIGRVISGITAASISTAGAYVADVTPPEKRAAKYGMLGAAFGLGFVLGPALGGVLGNVDPHLPFWVSAGLSLLNTLYGLFVLPESLPLDRRSKFSWRSANPLGSLKLLRSQKELLGLSAIAFCTYLAHEVLPSVSVLYSSHRYSWDAKAIGLSLAAIGVCSAVVQALLVQPIVGKIGERRTLLTSLFFGILAFAVLGLAPTGTWYLMGIPLMAILGLSNPSLQGLMTPLVSPQEQGQLQGAQSCLRGIAGMMGPGIFTVTFASSIGSYKHLNLPGAPFFISTLLLIVGLVLALKLIRRNRANERAS